MTDRIPLSAQIIEIEREIKMRQRVYPRRVADGKMSQATADKHIAAMGEVIGSLKHLNDCYYLIRDMRTAMASLAPDENCTEKVVAARLVRSADALLDDFPPLQEPELPL